MYEISLKVFNLILAFYSLSEGLRVVSVFTLQHGFCVSERIELLWLLWVTQVRL